MSRASPRLFGERLFGDSPAPAPAADRICFGFVPVERKCAGRTSLGQVQRSRFLSFRRSLLLDVRRQLASFRVRRRRTVGACPCHHRHASFTQSGLQR